ncbi:hypothetical protein [Sulfuricurvum sp.]|uniref:phage adaptor protein n=1 Tax=Sulfuricurvum sp. TaxID=2025608 RepID=UPI002606D275|nr:hypothetical protein [Sulfuricurvum sp.]MDD2267473.1 hypothetical protein [Sulfuricurvum sp.]
MNAAVLIGMMRSRLRDEAKEGWSDQELIDSINFALSAIAHRLLPWKSRYTFTAQIGIDTYPLPVDFMAPIALIYDGVMIPVKGNQWALSNDGNDQIAFLNGTALILTQVPDQEVEVSLNYHALIQIADISDELYIFPEIVDTVLFYALSLAIQKEPHEQSLAQSKYYMSLYESRCKDVSAVEAKRRSGITLKSTYQKV